MKFLIALATPLAFFGLASARIRGIAVPDTIAPGSAFRVIIETENYIQSVQDVAISFGYSPAATFYGDSLGTLLSSRFLGPDESNILTNVTHFVNIPVSAQEGPTVFTSDLFSLYGVQYSPSITSFTVNVTFGNFTSANYISSLE